jgi:hypothetical protein
MCWIRKLCSRDVGSVCSIRKCLSVYSMGGRSSESCLSDKVLDIDVMYVYVQTLPGAFRISNLATYSIKSSGVDSRIKV